MKYKDKVVLVSNDLDPVQGRTQACASCPAGCNLWAPSQVYKDTSDYVVSSQGLLQVVIVLFGVPLLGLLIVVASLYWLGYEQNTWLSMVILAGLGGLWFRLMGTYGGRLLNILCFSQGPSSSSSTALSSRRH